MNLTKALAVFLAAGALCTASEAKEKKVIVGGFETGRAVTSHLARNIEKFEKFPFDGFLVTFDVTSNRFRPRSNNFMTSRSYWEKEWFAKELSELKTIASGRYKNNFLCMFLSPPRRLAWDDDEAWKRCIHNAGVIAWLAKEGKCAGVHLDVEDYTLKKQFFHRPSDGPYEKFAELARKRGREMMNAFVKEYPDITVFTLMLFCETNIVNKNPDPFSIAKEHRDLWIHFVNGMLDVIPPQAKIVEGNEHSFWMNESNNDFSASLAEMKTSYRKIAYPENRNKYATNVSCAFAFYPDVFVKAIERKTPHAEVMRRFASNFGSAMRHTDEYVWFQCEHYRWLDNWDEEGLKTVNAHSGIGKETWEQKLPGLTRIMEITCDPEKYGSEQLASGKYVNLVRNPECVKTPPSVPENVLKANDWHQGSLPHGWNYWPDKDKDKIALDETTGLGDNTSIRVQGAANAALITIIPVESGKFYAVEGFCRGDGKLLLNIRWQNSKGWIREWANTADRLLVFRQQSGANASSPWRRAFTVIQAPEGAEKMVLLPSIRQEGSETCYFDKFTVFEVK